MAKKPKTKACPSTTPTLVTFLLDRSGSMSNCWEMTIEAFNGYVDGMRDVPDLDFTLVQFDHHGGGMQLEKVCVGVPVKTAPKLSKDNYQPRGSTPLIQAAYTVIKAVETSILDKPKDTKVVICIQTDGQENCSDLEHTWEMLSILIKAKQGLGWQFNFMGAGIDAYQQGARMGVRMDSTMSYNHTDCAATRAAFGASAQRTSLYASGMSASTAYTAADKQAAGDKFDPDSLGLTVSKPKVVQPTVHGGTGFSITPDLSTPPAKEKFKL